MSAAFSNLHLNTRPNPGAASSGRVPCREFRATGYCRNGDACRFLHELSLASASRSSEASHTRLSRPSPSDYIVRPVHTTTPQYVPFNAAYASLVDAQDRADAEELLRDATAPVDASAFVTSVRDVRASSYAAVAKADTEPTELPVGSAAWNMGRMPTTTFLRPSPQLCRYHIDGICRYGDDCRYLHGTRCNTCGKNAVHPENEEEAQRHIDSCEKEQERKNRVALCAEVECGICYESTVANGRKFGLLQNCDHAFCLSCIREWRGSESAGTFGREAVRVCPVCRTESFLVIPSDTYESDPDARAALLNSYKAKLATIACKYFDRGRHECPFGGSCLYEHRDANGNLVAAPGKPALVVSESGVKVKTKPRLADYFTSLDR